MIGKLTGIDLQLRDAMMTRTFLVWLTEGFVVLGLGLEVCR